MTPGHFITVEGGEGVGKSTNIARLKQRLEQAGITVFVTREPGGTRLAESIRDLLLKAEGEAPGEMTELLLVFASRAQHLQQVIRPQLKEGNWVICDRFTDATFAYQGAGRGLCADTITSLEDLVQGDLRPNLTLLLDAPAEIGLARARGRGELDRFERESLAFFNRVRDCYLSRAAADPSRFRVVDASRDLAQVQADVDTVAAELITWVAQENTP